MRALILGILLLAPVAEAQNRHLAKPWTWMKSNMSDAEYERWAEPRQHDHFYRSKVFWTGVAIIGVSLALDAHSTARGRAPLTESNHVLGQHASNGRIAGLATADFAAQFSFHFLAYKVSHNDPSRTWRSIGQWGVPSGVFLNNGVKGIKNYRNEAKYN